MDKSWLIREITDSELQNLMAEGKIEDDGIHICYEKDDNESKSKSESFEEQVSMPRDGLLVSAEYFESIRSEIGEDDQLWIFKSPDESWENLAGRAGFCVLQDGKIIESYLLILS